MENKPKHTPGPWRIGDAGNTVFGPNDGKICPAIIAALGRENHSANAALIAAAPEMLEALKMQEAANDERSMTIHYQEQEEGAKTPEQKKYAHDNYLESATKADTLQDKATELRRIAIAKAEGGHHA